jgi:DNA-binding NarL/FixJ family response regulator
MVPGPPSSSNLIKIPGARADVTSPRGIPIPNRANPRTGAQRAVGPISGQIRAQGQYSGRYTPARGMPVAPTPLAGVPRTAEPPPRRPGTPLRIALVEPETLFRGMMVDVVNRDSGMQVTVEADSCQQARELIRPGWVDVVVIEVDLPDGNGATLALDLQRSDSRLTVVVVTRHDVHSVIDSTRRHLRRPWGHLSKHATVGAAELLGTIRQAALAPDNTPPADDPEPEKPAPLNGLTAQQFAVLRLISEGFTNTQVADRLGLSRRTVENHLLGIYRVFDISSDEVNPRVTAVLRFLAHSIRY